MKTVVMRRTDQEMKDQAGAYGGVSPGGGDDYPYGLRINLDDSCLKKLGIDRLPRPGDKFRVEGEAHVLGSEQRDTDKSSDRQVQLVLHELGMQKKPDPSAPRDKTIREEIEDATHRARGTNARQGRIGARYANAR